MVPAIILVHTQIFFVLPDESDILCISHNSIIEDQITPSPVPLR